ncbi:glycosyltransferase family 4 protein [Janthinobacterium sp. BJB401]|uniref:glycosyltransferase n=1 Tax=Janthinobacterium sp. BJB401 TaxID=2745934 RepID=UPI00159512A5|nr:glycosyltransferase family 4 protein [Janthinobacterium sp. BJB401]NVI83737.1 glycosyltransferase [Janthinobacterium sp. BJB401]
MTKVLFFTTIDPSPRNNGKSVVLSGIFDYLQERHGKYFNVAVVGEFLGSDNIVETIERPSRLVTISNILNYTLLRRKKSIQECFFYSRKIRDRIQALIAEHKPDMVIFDTVRLAQYVNDLQFSGARKIVYLDDLFSLRYMRMAASDLKSIGVFGNFEKNIPSSLRFAVDKFDPLKKFILKYEADIIEKSEIRATADCDISLLISSSEVDYFKKRHGEMRLAAIPPFLPATEIVARNWDEKPNFIFLGSMNLPHNVAGLKVFLTSVFPRVLVHNSVATLTIIGGGVTDELKQCGQPFGQAVKFLGRVEELSPLLSNACALIAPLAFGSGVKLKIIDSLACSLPIISTDIGVEGIDFIHGVHGELANTWEDFSDSVLKLCDPVKNKYYSKNCKKLFDDIYAKDSIFDRYDDIFNQY